MKTLEQLRAELKAKHDALGQIETKALGDGATDEDLAAYKKELADIERLETQIETLAKAQEARARAAVPATGVPVQRTATDIQPKELDQERRLTFTAAAITVARMTGEHPFKVLEDEGFGQFAKELGEHPRNKRKAVNTLVSAEGGILVPQAQVGGIVPLLRGETTFLEAGPTPIQLVNGQYKVARGATGASAGYVGEGGRKPVSTPTFDAIDMRSKKCAGIVMLTQEARKWTIGNIEAYVRADLRAAIGQALDLHMWLGTGSGSSPLGVLNKAGIQTFTGTFASGVNPTLAELDAFANGMLIRMVTNNIFANRGRFRWVMSYRTAMFLGAIRTANGDLAFPTMQGAANGANLTWKGYPVSIVHQLPTTGGAGTDEALLALVDMSHVLFGEEEGINMRYSEQATIDPDGTGENNVLLWQDNMAAVLAEAEHDVGLRFSKAVVKATVRF